MRILNTELRYSLRMQVAYEQLAGHPYDGMHPVTDATLLLYCALITAEKPREGLTYVELLDHLDAHPGDLTRFCEWLDREAARIAELTQEEAPKDASGDADEKKSPGD